jgi:hypothetical protein
MRRWINVSKTDNQFEMNRQLREDREHKDFLERPSLRESKKFEPPSDPTTFRVVWGVDDGFLGLRCILGDEEFDSEEEAGTFIGIERTQFESEDVLETFIVEVF